MSSVFPPLSPDPSFYQPARIEEASVSPTGGLRYNVSKLPLSWVPGSLVKAVAAVLKKATERPVNPYPAHNWRKGLKWAEVSESLERHLIAWREGENLDPDTGLSHLWHMGCNIAFLIEFEEKKLGTDDRFVYPRQSLEFGTMGHAGLSTGKETMQ